MSRKRTEDGTVERSFEARQNYALEIEQFGRCIESGEEPRVSDAFSIRNSELLDKLLAKLDGSESR